MDEVKIPLEATIAEKRIFYEDSFKHDYDVLLACNDVTKFLNLFVPFFI